MGSDIARNAMIMKMQLQAKKDKYESMLNADQIKITLWSGAGESISPISLESEELCSTDFIKISLERKIIQLEREIEILGIQIEEMTK